MFDKNTFGIHAMSVYIPTHFIDLKTLAEANGIDPNKYYQGLGGHRMAIVTPDEDPVTMAAEASRTLLDRYEVDPSEIGMVIVGTESGVDGAKPIAAFVHGLLGLHNQCRIFDAQHACYGATAALEMARYWCAAQTGRRRLALVIATDVANYDVGSAGEPTQGAGAVAMLVGCEPTLLSFDDHREAVYAADVMDFWRPHYRTSAVVDGKFSLNCYLKALENTYAQYCLTSNLGWRDWRRLLFHVPFPKMAFKAFQKVHEMESSCRNGDFPDLETAYAELTHPALWANIEVGNIYSGSLYLSIAGLLEREDRQIENARIGLFSYGSGCCAEFFSGLVGPDAGAWRDRIGIVDALERRVEVDYQSYLDLRTRNVTRSRNGSFVDMVNGGSDSVRFMGVNDHMRIYAVPSGNDAVLEPAILGA
jgi:hydroxymethylglutaryl-CoA synthase